ncbi:unnamed protein product, partial [Brassica rapa subsp. trilocularis]
MQVDLKSFIYDKIHLQRIPSWLNKPSILPQVQIETILWGLETFSSKRLLIAASMQPARMEELETCFGDDNRFIAKHENQIKGCLLSH